MRRDALGSVVEEDVADSGVMFYREAKVVELAGQLLDAEMAFFREWDDEKRIEVLDAIIREVNVETMRFRIGHDVLNKGIEMLSRAMGAACAQSPRVAAMIARLLGRLARTHGGFVRDGMRKQFCRSCKDVLSSGCEELVRVELEMIGEIAGLSPGHALLFVEMCDQVLEITCAIRDEYQPPERPPEEDEYETGYEYDRKTPLAELNPGLFAFREIVKWQADKFRECIRDVFQRIWKCCSVYKQVSSAVEACIRIFTDLLTADIPGVFEMFDKCCVMNLASELVLNSGSPGCEEAGLRLIRSVYERYPEDAVRIDDTTTPETIMNCCKHYSLSVRIEAWRCLSAMVNAYSGASDILMSIIDSELLLGSCRLLENSKFDELVAILELMKVCLCRVDGQHVLKCLDIRYFVKRGVELMELDNDITTNLCIDILASLYEQLMKQGLVDEYFSPQWEVSHGNDVLERISMSYECESAAEKANSLMSLMKEQ